MTTKAALKTEKEKLHQQKKQQVTDKNMNFNNNLKKWGCTHEIFRLRTTRHA